MNIEWALNAWLGDEPSVCVFSRQCGRAIAVEHDGGVYACDHYVYPEYRLGDLRSGNLLRMVEQSVASGFGPHKEATLPQQCRDCDVLLACWGGCPKHRFATTADGAPGLHYLCGGYKRFFRHVGRHAHVFKQLLDHDLPASLIMQAFNRPLVIPLREPGQAP